MIRRPPRSTRTDTLFPYTTLFRSFASQVDVYKSPTADMLESGLAATVNMQSIRPLAIGKRRVAMTVEGAYNEQARGSIRPHISALYTDTFLDNRLGWSIAVDINKRSIDDQQFAKIGRAPVRPPVTNAQL